MTGFLIMCESLFLNWIPLAVLGMAIFRYPNGLAYSALLVMAAGTFAISPLNERIGRMDLGCRPPTTEERQKITGVWHEVVDAIGQALDSSNAARFAVVNLFVSDERLPNAFALGRNTVCVTKGLLSVTSPGDLAGALAHEAGHLHFGDAERLAVALTANWLGVASYRILSFCSGFFDSLARGLMRPGKLLTGSAGSYGALIGLIIWLAVVVVNTAIKVFSFVFQTAVDMSLRAVGRNEEFRADLFARNIGFGPQLANFLRQIEALDATPKDLWEVLQRPHPSTAERIDRLLQNVG
jgi:heat shock protein HtpX